jgi:hypothetical protein
MPTISQFLLFICGFQVGLLVLEPSLIKVICTVAAIGLFVAFK